MTNIIKLPEAVGVSLLTPVDVFSSALVAKVEIFVSVKVVVLLADPVAVDILGVWLGVVTLELVIVNDESVVPGTDGIRSDALLVVLCLAVVVVPLSSVAFRVVV